MGQLQRIRLEGRSLDFGMRIVDGLLQAGRLQLGDNLHVVGCQFGHGSRQIMSKGQPALPGLSGPLGLGDGDNRLRVPLQCRVQGSR